MSVTSKFGSEPTKALTNRFRAVLATGVVLSLILGGLLLVQVWRQQGALQGALNAEGRLLRLADRIIYLDEVLTMSARQAAATGGLAWEQRYRRAKAELDRALELADQLGPDTYRQALLEARAANRVLSALDEKSFELARQGRGVEAMEILDDRVYQRHKAAYARNLEVAMESLQNLAQQSLAEQEQSGWRLFWSGALVLAMLLVLWAWLAWLTGRHEQVHRESDRRLGRVQQMIEERVMERTVQQDAANQILTNQMHELERKLEHLEGERRHLETILNSVHDAIFVQDPVSGEVAEANQAASRMLGYGLDELKRLKLEDVSVGDPASAREAAQYHIAAALRGDPQVFTWLARRRNGQEFWVEISLRLTQLRDRAMLVSVMRDIDLRKRAEDMVLTYSRRLVRMFEEAPAALAMLDRGLDYLHVSSRWQEDLGLAGRKLTGRSLIESLPGAPAGWSERLKGCLDQDREDRDRQAFRLTDGGEASLRWVARPWHDEEGQVGGLILFVEAPASPGGASEPA